ncbi:NUDIX domain-containing protein [Lysinibacillus sp. KU-BSD001]|uniref:NUDIX domain-containing protein n=1 Tax=Lysinibacillus sp. KU-BSD001 TaxID=3141328 RepID=UPI0036DFBDB7
MIEDNGKILLLNRTDEDTWCIPGGPMEMVESFEQTAKWETYEETGLDVTYLQILGIYSGEACFVEYSNKNQVDSV